MITLNILQLLQDNGFGTIAIKGNEPNADLFHEKLPIGKTGLYIMSRGSGLNRGSRRTQSFDIYARGKNDLEGAEKLERILEFFQNECYPVCTLPSIPNNGLDYNEYIGCTIVPTSNIENVGFDNTDRVIYVVSAEVKYNKTQES